MAENIWNFIMCVIKLIYSYEFLKKFIAFDFSWACGIELTTGNIALEVPGGNMLLYESRKYIFDVMFVGPFYHKLTVDRLFLSLSRDHLKYLHSPKIRPKHLQRLIAIYVVLVHHQL